MSMDSRSALFSWSFTFFPALLSLLCIGGIQVSASYGAEFEDLGVMVPVAETRMTIATKGPENERLLINVIEDSAMKGTATGSSTVGLLIHDLTSGTTAQYFPTIDSPEPEDAFSALVSSKHKLYFNRCNAFDEFDLKSRTFTFQTADVGGYTMSMAEAADGKIYFATYPGCWLSVYDPETQKIEKLIQLDETQQYPTRMAIDADGWLYAGIGTEKSNLVGYNIKTGEKIDLVSDADRNTNDGGFVIADEKGDVYGRGGKLLPWQKFRGGKGVPAPGFSPDQVKIPKNSTYYMSSVKDFPDGAQIENYSMLDRSFEVVEKDGKTQSFSFDYQTSGAAIGSLTLARPGTIIGSVHHPQEMWEYDIASKTAKCLGHLPKVGGGCLTKFVKWNGYLVSNSYARGDLYVFDPKKKFNISVGPEENPKWLLRTEPAISRPHTILRYPNSPLIVSAGWPSYGMVGGGMLIYDMEKREKVALLDAEKLVPGHSITSMVALPGGNIVFGTAALALGGAVSGDDSAKIGIFDWKKKSVSWTDSPAPHSDYIASICLNDEGNLYGVTHDGVFFVYDLANKKILATHQLEKKYKFPAAHRADNAFIRHEDGRIFLLMTGGIFSVQPKTFDLKFLASPSIPIFEGGFIVGDKMYFSSAGHLWTYQIPQTPPQEKIP